MPITLQCAYCRNPFSVKPHLAQKQLYCSANCYKAAGRDTEICAACGITFETFKSTKNHQKYCSKECYNVATTNPPRETICVYCARPFRAKAYKFIMGEAKYCSRKCRVQDKRGEKAANWKGGWKSYYGPDWNQARKAARKHAGYKCERCGIEQRKLRRALDVHHKIPARCFPTPNDAHYPANLIALCVPCHSIVEQEGYKETPLFN